MSKISAHEDLKSQFVELLRQAPSGLSNEQLQRHFGSGKMGAVAQVVNELLEQKRLNLFTQSGGLLYKLVDEGTAAKFEGLTKEQMLVHQICDKAGTKGVWTRDIKNQSNIPQHTLNKTLKELEMRNLIKYVRSVTSKSRKLYMLYDREPAKEITGGPWYTDQEFDHAFVEDLCKAIVNFVGTSSRRGEPLLDTNHILSQLTSTGIIAAGAISVEELEMVLNMLVYDGRLEEVRNTCIGNHGNPHTSRGVIKYKVSKKITAPNHLTEMPCGVCPVVAQCREGGVISPSTCVYMNDWLSLDYHKLDKKMSQENPYAW
jgi:DNA-directed RNA polymerase III subunit RPC6